MTMTVTPKQMEIMGITGDLVGLRVSDGKGGYVDATVVSKDSNGLPTAFTFPVAASDYESGYIKVQEKAQLSVPVDAMNDWMDARIKVDTASAAAQPEEKESSCNIPLLSDLLALIK